MKHISKIYLKEWCMFDEFVWNYIKFTSEIQTVATFWKYFLFSFQHVFILYMKANETNGLGLPSSGPSLIMNDIRLNSALAKEISPEKWKIVSFLENHVAQGWCSQTPAYQLLWFMWLNRKQTNGTPACQKNLRRKELKMSGIRLQQTDTRDISTHSPLTRDDRSA